MQENLVCLPLFLAGCNSLLILAGHTWLSRLWCVVEVACWAQMRGSSGMRWADDVDFVDLRSPSAFHTNERTSSGFETRFTYNAGRRASLSVADSVKLQPSYGRVGKLIGAVRRSAPRKLRLQSIQVEQSDGPERQQVSSRSNQPPRMPDATLYGDLDFNEQLIRFDVRAAKTTFAFDYELLISVVEASSGDLLKFNEAMRRGLSHAMARADAQHGGPTTTSRASRGQVTDGSSACAPAPFSITDLGDDHLSI